MPVSNSRLLRNGRWIFPATITDGVFQTTENGNIGAQYNVGNLPTDFKAFGKDFSSLKNYRYQGWMAGAGIGYGYDWALSRHFNLEFELGMGVIYTGYEKYDCPQCGKKVDENQKFMIAPTKAALSLVYLF